jgi:predicted Rossmann-fold nucleotide-binding protein
LIEWIKTVLIQEKTVGPDDLKLIKIVDTEDEVVEVLDAFYKKYNFKPNFNYQSCFITALFCYFSF